MTNSVRVTGICGACGRKHELLCTLALRHVQFECKGCGVRNETPVPSTSESVHRGASPTDWRCRCVAQPVDGIGALIGRMSREESALDDGNFIDDRARGVADATRHWRKELERIASRCDDPMGMIRAELEAEDNDGPGEEDGPWAAGYEHRSATSGSATQPHSVPKQAGDVPGWVQDEVNRATRQYRHNTDNSPNILSPEEGFAMAYDPQVIDALIRRLLAGGPLDPKEYTPVHNAVLRFLWGTAPYNGLWFHEAGARAHGSYWWRKYLPKPEGGEDG